MISKLFKLTKRPVVGIVISLIALSITAQAGLIPHSSFGIVDSSAAGDRWTFYVVARPAERITNVVSAAGGGFYWRAEVNDLPTTFADGNDSLVFISRETGAGTAAHRGFYAVMNEDLDQDITPQPYNNCTVRAIPTPAVAAGDGRVNVSWVAAAVDASATPHGNNIAGYNVYRSTRTDGGFVKINPAVVAGLSFADTTGVVGTTYYYTIEPSFRGGIALGVQSANSASIAFPAVANIAPNAPSALGPAAYVNGSWGNDNTPTLTFTLSDPDAGQTVRYQIQIDDDADFSADLVVDTTSALGAQGAKSYTPAALPDANYYWRVRCQDASGDWSGWTAANAGGIAFRIDTTTPTRPATVNDGVGADLDEQNEIDTLSANWTVSTDDGSGIARYEYSIGTAAGGTNVVGWTSNAASRSVTRAGLALVVGNTYYVNARAVDNVGNVGVVRSSDGVLITEDILPLNISTLILADGTVGVAYNQPVVAAGGVAPYSWSISAGTLPTGLNPINAGTGRITGTPTAAGARTFTVQVRDSAAIPNTDTQELTITINPAVVAGPTISGALPATASIGQTITINGAGFGAVIGASTVTIGGVAAIPTSWRADRIIVTVPAGVAAGAANIVVTVGGAASAPFGITITAGGDSSIIVIDDMEGGAVGNFEAPALASGYYVFDLYDATVADPRNTTSYPDRSLTSVAAEVREGSQAMELMYDYASRRAEPHAAAADADWGGGWGAILASERNVSTANTIYFWLRGEGAAGSGNRVRVELQDADGTVFASSDPNNPAAGTSLNFEGYTQIAIPMSRFVNNAAQTASTYQKPAGNATMDWARIVKYNFIYATTNDNATEANHYVDTIWAGHSDVIPTSEAIPVTVSPSTAYVGQTIVITGSGFGATQGTSTITIGGVAVHPTVWSTGSITAAVPSGVSGAAAVRLTVGANAYAGTVNITAGGAVIEDYEGGSVDDWEFDYTGDGNADSGYYVFASVQDITPNNETINANLRQAAAARNGSFGARVRYSYVGTDGSDWGGGWGASLANTLNLDPYDTVNLSVRWDGSSNAFKLSLRDSKGTIYAATVSNAQLVALAGTYGEIRINKTSFIYDAEDPANVAGALNWTEIVSYNLAYITPNTSSADHYIDSITAGDVTLGGGGTGEVIPTDVNITAVSPSSAPAGTAFTLSGAGFGTSQGSSVVVFENQLTRISYPVEIKAWGNTTIEAKIPTPAPVGNYTLKVIKIAVSAGTLRASESNPAAMTVTSILAEGTALVFPNPFNPLATTPAANGRAVNQATIVFTTTGSQDIGIYIYDMTGRQVRHETTTAAQWIWDGRDQNNNIVADGLYLLRIVNEETKKLIAKSKILVTKK